MIQNQNQKLSLFAFPFRIKCLQKRFVYGATVGKIEYLHLIRFYAKYFKKKCKLPNPCRYEVQSKILNYSVSHQQVIS